MSGPSEKAIFFQHQSAFLKTIKQVWPWDHHIAQPSSTQNLWTQVMKELSSANILYKLLFFHKTFLCIATFLASYLVNYSSSK